MRVEVTFKNTRNKTLRVVTVEARSITEGLPDARAQLYRELDDKQEYVTWGITSVRSFEHRAGPLPRGVARAADL